MNPDQVRVVMWGTYDLGKPRNRILIGGLRESGVAVTECHVDVWSGVEDKAVMKGWRPIVGKLLKWLLAYPVLIWRYLRLPKHDAVIVGYLGHLDVLVLWPFAKLRGVPVVWDAFLSLYETVVEDRAMVGPRNPVAWLLWAWDWLACRAADLVLLDTAAHAAWFADTFHLRRERTAAVFVGAEPGAFAHLADKPSRQPGDPVRILFYGQFIPLHGIATIIEAASRTTDKDYRWTIIGTGQEAPRIKRLLHEHPIPNLEWISWVPYDQLRTKIAEADICLGIFGESGKAGRVIPNKAFQVIAAGRPLITRDSPAIRELVDGDAGGVRLVTAGDAKSLLDGIADMADRDMRAAGSLRDRISPLSIGRALGALLSSLVARRA